MKHNQAASPDPRSSGQESSDVSMVNSKMNDTQTFKRDHGGQRAPLILCIIISIVTTFTSHSLYYIQYYLFIAAIFGYYISTLDLLTLDSNGLEINLGILSSKRIIFVEWEIFKQIDIVQDPREWRTKTFGVTFGGGGSHRPFDEMCVQIQLVNSLPQSMQNIIEKHGNTTFNRIFLRDEGKTIIILNPLNWDYETICDSIRAYLAGRSSNTVVPKQSRIKAIDISLMGMPVFIGAYNIFC